MRVALTSMATIVSFHAHPDDEAIWTGGTLARLAAEGHRVVIVLACDGAMWPHHGTVRLEQFRASAAILGAARAEHLGYADSGHGPVLFEDPPDRVRFARANLDEAAGRLADIIRSEDADLLLATTPPAATSIATMSGCTRVAARAAEPHRSPRARGDGAAGARGRILRLADAITAGGQVPDAGLQ